MTCHNLGSPIIDGIFLVQKMCIYSSVMIITTVLISHGHVSHVYIMMHHKLTAPLNWTVLINTVIIIITEE